MKKIWSTLLVCLLVISSLPAFIVSAEGPAGYMTSASGQVTEAKFDFENYKGSIGSTMATIQDASGNNWTFVTRQRKSGDQKLTIVTQADGAAFKAKGDKYVVLGAGEETGEYQRFGISPAVTDMGAGEALRVSFDIKNDSFSSVKQAVFAMTQNVGSSSSKPQNYILQMNTDGTISCLGTKTGVSYVLDQWYHFDYVLTWASEGASDKLDCYMDGKLIASTELNFSTWNFTFFGFLLNMAEKEAGNTMCVDNLALKIYDAASDPTEGISAQPLYLDFQRDEVEAAVTGGTHLYSDKVYLIKTDAANFNNSLVSGRFGKSSADKSLKIETKTDVERSKANQLTGEENIYYYSDAHMTLNRNNSMEGKALAEGESMKLSFSFAYDASAVPNTNEFFFIKWGTGHFLRLFFATGKLSVSGGTTADIHLDSGKWYNIDVIGTNVGGKLSITLYVNGQEEASGVTSVKPATYAATRIGIRSLVEPTVNGEKTTYKPIYNSTVYLDDFYVNTYAADETPIPNSYTLTNASVDLTENGKILLSDTTYTVGRFKADAVGDERSVYIDGAAAADDAALLGATVVLGENSHRPIYLYGVVPFSLGNVKTLNAAGQEVTTLTNGRLTAELDADINQSDKSITLFMAAYKADGSLYAVDRSVTFNYPGVIKTNLDITDEVASVKIFVLSDVAALQPYMAYISRTRS